MNRDEKGHFLPERKPLNIRSITLKPRILDHIAIYSTWGVLAFLAICIVPSAVLAAFLIAENMAHLTVDLLMPVLDHLRHSIIR